MTMTTTDLTPKIIRSTDDDTGDVTTVVRYWSVYEQRWVEQVAARIPDAELAAMSAASRAVVESARGA